MKRSLVSLALAAALAWPAAAQEKVVNVYNWTDYVDPTVLEDFTKETGIKVVYDTYDNNEIVETKMLAGKSGYDLVVPSGPFLQRMIAAGVFRPLDRQAMQQAAQALLGEHDFTSFRASSCQAHSPVKQMRRIEISQRGAYWRFEFEANAFLHHMIRNIMGCLLAVGAGHRPPAWMAEVLAARSRDAAAPTFAPDGLYFLGPVYDPAFGLPDRTPAFDWLP